MKKYLNSIAVVLLLAVSVVVLNSCSDSDPVPTDVITDNSGIKLDLKWSIPGSSADPKHAADLDLRIYKNGILFTESDNGLGYFEALTLNATNMTTFTDGTYVVKVLLFSTSSGVNYVVTADGITVSKTITFTSNFPSSPGESEVETLTIIKAGSNYTITQ